MPRIQHYILATASSLPSEAMTGATGYAIDTELLYVKTDSGWESVSGGSGLTQPQVLARSLGA